MTQEIERSFSLARSPFLRNPICKDNQLSNAVLFFPLLRGAKVGHHMETSDYFASRDESNHALSSKGRTQFKFFEECDVEIQIAGNQNMNLFVWFVQIV